MKDTFFEIRFGRALLVFTRGEFRKALKRGRTVEKNQRAAKERRQAGGHAHRLHKTFSEVAR
jgi:hypothetical protein